jgi:hypothetical protein
MNLFKDEAALAEELKVVRKLPYKFSYRFKDIEGKESKLMIEDWEIGALYWNCLRSSQGNEAEAIDKVKTKYWDEFVVSKRFSPSLILGTTLEHHNKKAPNPFVIISVLAPPLELQQRCYTKIFRTVRTLSSIRTSAGFLPMRPCAKRAWKNSCRLWFRNCARK